MTGNTKTLVVVDVSHPDVDKAMARLNRMSAHFRFQTRDKFLEAPAPNGASDEAPLSFADRVNRAGAIAFERKSRARQGEASPDRLIDYAVADGGVGAFKTEDQIVQGLGALFLQNKPFYEIGRFPYCRGDVVYVGNKLAPSMNMETSDTPIHASVGSVELVGQATTAPKGLIGLVGKTATGAAIR